MKKVALVHDFLTQYGGAERVLAVLSEMFPDAPVYTLLYDREKMRGKFADKDIRTSFLQKFPRFLRRRVKYLLPLLPVAPETFDLREFDLVISSSGAWSKGIVTRLNTVHVSYVHSPMRFVWDTSGTYLGEQRKSGFTNFFARMILNYIRVWDKVAADRPDFLLANSKYTQDRIKKYYGRESAVICPPVDEKLQISNYKFQINSKSQIKNFKTDTKYRIPDTRYFLIVSRLSPYKKIDAVIEAFNKLGLPLAIVGEGSQEKYLKSIAGENVKFLGWKKDEEIEEIYRNARGFVFAGVDDFGIAPVEAMARGIPVVSIGKGGIREAMIEGRTGEFFDAPTPEVIADGVRRFMENEKNYDRNFIKENTERFGKKRFVKEFREFIEKVFSI